MERRIWTEEEDRVLMNLMQKRRLTQWSVIAKVMQIEYGIEGRSGKQCRERYLDGQLMRWFNKLNPALKNGTWSPEEELELFRLYETYGNRWSDLTRLMPHRSENCIKNHVYSTLRKGFRLILRYMKKYSKQLQVKPFKDILLNKIVLLAELKIPNKYHATQQQISSSICIRQGLIKYAMNQETGDEQNIRKIISDMVGLTSKVVRRNPKKRSKLFSKTYVDDDMTSGLSTVTDLNTQKEVKEEEIKVEAGFAAGTQIIHFGMAPAFLPLSIPKQEYQDPSQPLKFQNSSVQSGYVKMALKFLEDMLPVQMHLNQPYCD